MDVRDLVVLKEKIDKLARERERAIGVLEQLLKTLKEEYGCEDIEKAKLLLEKMRSEKDILQREVDGRYRDFQEKWGGSLDGFK